MKIKTTLILGTSIIVFVCLLGSIVFMYFQIKSVLYNDLKQVLEIKTNEIVLDLYKNEHEGDEEHGDENTYTEINEHVVENLIENNNIINNDYYIAFVNASNTLVYASENFNVYHYKSMSFPQIKDITYFIRKHDTINERILFIAVPLVQEDNQMLFIYCGYSLMQIDKNLLNILIFLLVVSTTILILIVIGTWLIIKKGFAPINKIITTVKSNQKYKQGFCLPYIKTNNEIRELTEEFNSLFYRIDKSFMQIEQFTTDASHELRTPIAIIQGAAQVSLRKKRERSEYIKTLQSIEQETRHIEKLIRELLLLCRLDNWEHEEHEEQIDLTVLLTNLSKNYKMDIKICSPTPAMVSGYRSLLKSVFSNLLDNSYKFGGETTEVLIDIEEKDEAIFISYKDFGKLVTDDTITKLFDRFYQEDYSRSEKQGLGLGLSIVKSIIELHKGSIQAEKTFPSGITFKIIL